jgi:hypothetical protein
VGGVNLIGIQHASGVRDEIARGVAGMSGLIGD